MSGKEQQYMHKKKLVVLLLVALFATSLFGQKERTKNLPKFDHHTMHFGFLIGINSANFVVRKPSFDPSNPDSILVIEPVSAPGFNLGIISSLKFNEYFSIRFTPNLAFSSRSLEYTFETVEGIRKYEKIIESTLINFPINIKYKSMRLNNFGAYVIFGAAYTLDLASDADATNQSKNLNEIFVKLKRDDYVGQIGFGTDFYLQYFKFGIEVKMSYGIRDLLERDNTPFSNPIEKLSSKMFLLSFTFEG